MQDYVRGTEPMKLTTATLGEFGSEIKVPQYDRSALTAGIVHIGVGNFHRAHQAWYTHCLMQQGSAQDWAIIGAGVHPNDAVMREKLRTQDYLTTLVELDPSGVSVEVTGPMIDFLATEPGHPTLIRTMADPSTRIVSLTVTEGGYYLDATTGKLDLTHADIKHDAQNAASPRTAFGAIVAALKLRHLAGVKPFTAMSCDNLQGNGTILRQCVVGLAELSDPELARWIDAECTFPNSMVDCIVPATTPEVIAQTKELGIDDRAPVTHENYRQWVIEDTFVSGRPDWEAVGATLTTDVHSYEAMKIRILNGGHQLLANVAEVLSVPTIADCMRDEQIAQFFRKVQQDEILPQVGAVVGMDPASYLTLIERRFANPMIHDTTRRVAFDGSSRHTGFLLPTIRDALNAGHRVDGLALAEAFWARMCAGVREDGTEIQPNDPHWDTLHNAAQDARTDAQEWLAQHSIYGELSSNEAFSQAFKAWLDHIWTHGCRATMAKYLND